MQPLGNEMQKLFLNHIQGKVCLNGKQQWFTVRIIPVEEEQEYNNYEIQEDIMKESLSSSGASYDSV